MAIKKRTKINFSVSVNFNLRTTIPSNKLTTVRCIVRYDNNRIVLPSPFKIEPRYWNEKKQEARNNQRMSDGTYINSLVKDHTRKIESIFNAYTGKHSRYPTPDTFKSLVLDELNKTDVAGEQAIINDFISFTEQFIFESETGLRLSERGTPIAHNTLKIYNTFKINLKDFKAKKNYNLDLENMGLEFFEDFKEYMVTEKMYATNTVAKHIRTIKTIMTEAKERGLTTTIFSGKRYKATTEETDSIYLNEAELEILYKLNLQDNPRLDRVRDLFLVGCWTGFRFSDLTNISKKNIKGDFIEIKTQKTGGKVIVPIHSCVAEIMEKYHGKTENNLPPGITNQKLNEYIKEVGEKAEFFEMVQQKYTKAGKRVVKNSAKYKLISSHTARRSFATNMYKSGFPTLSIMAITGHKTESSFMKYIKVTPMEHAEKLMELWNKPKLRVVNLDN